MNKHLHSESGHMNDNETEKRVLSKAFLRVAEELQLSRQELCSITGISEASMSRIFDHKRLIDPSSKEGELALLLIRVFRSLDILFGGNSQHCNSWFRAYNDHLNGIPAELVKTIPGLNEVVMYLDAIRGKV